MRAAVLVALLSIALRAQAPAEGRLDGMVLGGNHQPLHAAKVWVEHGGERIATTTADALGWFVVGRLPLAELVVRASGAGRTGVAVVRPSVAGSLGFARLSTFPTRRLEVVVRDAEGAAVAGADVMATSNGPDALPSAAVRGTTDAEGRCTLADVIIGSTDVLARHGETMGKVTVDGADDLAVEVPMPRKSERRVRLRVDDASPEQIAAARVVLRCEERDELQILPLPAGGVQFHADGTAVIPWLPMGVRLRLAVRSDACWFAPRFDWVPPFQSDVQIVFRPAPQAVVRATLQDRTGAPVQRAAVMVGTRMAGFAPYPAVVAITAADGSFAAEMPLMPEDSYSLQLPNDLAFDPEGAMLPNAFTLVRKYGSEPPGPLRVGPCIPFGGSVRDARGAPAPGVVVTVSHEDRRLASSQTGPDGTFRIALPHWARDATPGTLQLFAEGSNGYARVEVPLGVDGPARVDAVLEAANVVTGRVLDPAGRPAAGARVSLHPSRDEADHYAASVLWTVAERDGSFRFSGHVTGEHTVRSGDSKRDVKLPAGEATLPDLVVDR